MTLMVIWDVCLIEEEIKSHSWRQMSWIEGMAQLPQFTVNLSGLSHDYFASGQGFWVLKTPVFYFKFNKAVCHFQKTLRSWRSRSSSSKSLMALFLLCLTKGGSLKKCTFSPFQKWCCHILLLCVPVYSSFVVFVLQGFFLFAGCPSLWPTS